MKKFLAGIWILSTMTTFCQNVAPSEKVLQAFSSSEIARMQQSEIARLNLRGDKLCWFEEVKPSASFTPYQLVSKDGRNVSISSNELNTFNPLLYNLPQRENTCENLFILTSDGKEKLLVVRSETMMRQEWERSLKSKK